MREVAITALGMIGGEEALHVIRESLFEVGLMLDAVEAVKLARDTSSVQYLVEILDMPDEMIKIYNSGNSTFWGDVKFVHKCIIETLRELGDKSAAKAIRKFLYHEDAELRKDTIFTLGKLGTEREIMPLIRVMKNDTNFRARGEAARSLGRIGDKRATKSLIKKLGDVLIMPWVAEALEDMDDERAVKPLIDVWWQIPEYAKKVGELGFAFQASYISSAKFAVEKALDTLGADVDQLYMEKKEKEID